jgi:peptidoglycan hydrolase-like protein with peptidoglycan-binding domain
MLMVAPARSQERTPPDSRLENPAADAAAADAEDQQRDLAFKIFPSLLEIGLDVTPGDDPAKSVLAAVNGLRRQDKQPPIAALDDDSVAYVDQKVAAYRTERLLTIRIQGALDALGFEPGPIDGIYGPLTAEGVRRYQRSVGMPPTGTLTAQQVDALEMKSVDTLMRPPVPQPAADSQAPLANEPAADSGTVVATPANAPEIAPDILDWIGR